MRSSRRGLRDVAGRRCELREKKSWGSEMPCRCEMWDARWEMRDVSCELCDLWVGCPGHGPQLWHPEATATSERHGVVAVVGEWGGVRSGSLGGWLLVVFVADCTPRYRQIVPAAVGSHYGQLIFALEKHNKAASGQRRCLLAICYIRSTTPPPPHNTAPVPARTACFVRSCWGH